MREVYTRNEMQGARVKLVQEVLASDSNEADRPWIDLELLEGNYHSPNGDDNGNDS